MINAIVTRRLPVWDTVTGWSAPQPTTSIAWAFADACRAQYGAKLADARIDLNALTALDQVWTARGDSFNAIFDSSLTVWEALIWTCLNKVDSTSLFRLPYFHTSLG